MIMEKVCFDVNGCPMSFKFILIDITKLFFLKHSDVTLWNELELTPIPPLHLFIKISILKANCENRIRAWDYHIKWSKS